MYFFLFFCIYFEKLRIGWRETNTLCPKLLHPIHLWDPQEYPLKFKWITTSQIKIKSRRNIIGSLVPIQLFFHKGSNPPSALFVLPTPDETWVIFPHRLLASLGLFVLFSVGDNLLPLEGFRWRWERIVFAKTLSANLFFWSCWLWGVDCKRGGISLLERRRLK